MVYCSEIKKISLVSLLEKMGAKKSKETQTEIFFLSPFRNENTASFKVDINKNIWYDFGEGIGGNIFDFVMRLKECDFKEALHFLRNEFESFSFRQPETNSISRQINKGKSYSINKVQPLQNTILIEYLKSRSLNIDICKKYLDEVYYLLKDKKYFGIGFKNNLKGFEIRNKYVKLCLGKKWYSLIKNNKQNVIVFESWSDFLSMLSMYPKTEISNDFLILNSLSMLAKVDEVFSNYNCIFWCLDNDEAGKKATENGFKKWKEKSVDVRYLFTGFKDFNDYLIHNRQR